MECVMVLPVGSFDNWWKKEKELKNKFENENIRQPIDSRPAKRIQLTPPSGMYEQVY
jgi:hypothetical protein